MMAIDMAKRGRNVLGTAEQMVAVSEGEDFPPPEMRRQVRLWRQGKARRREG